MNGHRMSQLQHPLFFVHSASKTRTSTWSGICKKRFRFSSICQETQGMHLWKADFPPPSSPLLHWISDSVPLQMLSPVLLTIQGTVGAGYCVVISSLGLLSGPFCDTGSGNYTYPFRNDSLEWVAFMVLGQCLTSNDDTADDHKE